MSLPEKAPARLEVLLAREAPYGVIFRRGPSKQVAVIGWDRRDDSFQLGQWLKGRIYTSRCDLSPNGRHLIYLAYKYNPDSSESSYTVVSKAPYLKALQIWKGGAWVFGGGWIDDSNFWLDAHPSKRGVFSLPHFVNSKKPFHWENSGNDSNDPHAWRLRRDGWILQTQAVNEFPKVHTWEKRLQDWILTYSTLQSAKWKGNIYSVCNLTSGENLDCTGWTWADFDGKRLAYAQDGKLFATKIWAGGRAHSVELADFNAMTFEAVAAPY